MSSRIVRAVWFWWSCWKAIVTIICIYKSRKSTRSPAEYRPTKPPCIGVWLLFLKRWATILIHLLINCLKRLSVDVQLRCEINGLGFMILAWMSNRRFPRDHICTGLNASSSRLPIQNSPCDGTVLYLGPVDLETRMLEQVKGTTYSMDEFLGPLADNGTRQGKTDHCQFYQCVIYLAPGDYHHFQSPTNWTVKIRRHFTGKVIILSNIIPGFR